jgi:hypothetical protein
MATGRLDLLRLGKRSRCGRLYPLNDPIPLSPAYWILVRVVPRL